MMEYQPKTTRDLLTDLGVGGFNATMVVEMMMLAPATTDPASPPVVILTGAIQDNLNAMGAGLSRSRIIDPATAVALERVAGPRFLHMPWFDLCKRVITARRAGKSLRTAAAPLPATNSHALGTFDLPDIPGGMITYGVLAYVGYRVWKKRKRS